MSVLLWLLRLLLGRTDIVTFVNTFGDPKLALAAIVVICLTVVLLAAMVIWQSIHLRRLRLLAEVTLLRETGRPVRRTRRFLGRVIWEYEQVVGEPDRADDDRPKGAVTPVRDAPPPSTSDAGG